MPILEPILDSDTDMDSLLGLEVSQILTTRLSCLQCKRSFVVPKSGDQECGECEYCGNTSFSLKDGRPWGHAHRYWKDWIKSLYSLDDKNCITRATLSLFYDFESAKEYMVVKSIL